MSQNREIWGGQKVKFSPCSRFRMVFWTPGSFSGANLGLRTTPNSRMRFSIFWDLPTLNSRFEILDPFQMPDSRPPINFPRNLKFALEVGVLVRFSNFWTFWKLGTISDHFVKKKKFFTQNLTF